jgi:N12 class adenine-specific DNA methylase
MIEMSFEEIVVYGITLLIVVKLFFFFRRIYKNCIRRVIFPRKVFKEELEENQKDNERYKEKKQKELIKRQETLRENQKDDVQIYQEDLEVVDIAKPVGKWTQMVIFGGGLMKRLAQLINREGGHKGYWELFIKAQSSTQGKYKGKGR